MPQQSNKKSQSRLEEQVKSYERARDRYLAFTGKLSGLLKDLLESADIKYHIIESRTKNITSFRDKIARAGKSYENPLTEIRDLSGLRVIVYYLEDVRAVCRLIEREFFIDQDSSIDKGELLKPNEFGYRSVHYIVSLLGSRDDLLEWRAFAGLNAEIQVRTVLQHAWASISHTLEYKREEEVPSPLRRKLSRLAGLLELSDEEFSDLRVKEREFSGNVVRELGRGETNLELNAVSLTEYISELNSLGFIVEAGNAAGFTIDSDIEVKPVSDLIALCVHVGVKTIKQFADEINSSRPWVREYLKKQLDAGPGTGRRVEWAADGPFLAELVLIRIHADLITADYLVEKGWARGIASSVVQIARSGA